MNSVIKRDGAVEVFSQDKLRRSIEAAARAARQGDPLLAGEISDVAAKLWSDGGDARSSILAIKIEDVLRQTGLLPWAEAFSACAAERARLRERIALRWPDSQVAGPWSKGRLARWLHASLGVSPDLAASIGRAVEARLFASGLRRISENLLRELVSVELVERGHALGLRRHAAVAWRRDGLERLIEQAAADGRAPGAVARELGQETLRLYSRDFVLPPHLIEAEERGWLSLGSMGRWIDVESASLFADRLLESFAPLGWSGPPADAFDLSHRLRSAIQAGFEFLSGPLYLAGLGRCRAAMAGDPLTERAMQAALAAAPGKVVVLSDDDGSGPASAALFENVLLGITAIHAARIAESVEPADLAAFEQRLTQAVKLGFSAIQRRRRAQLGFLGRPSLPLWQGSLGPGWVDMDGARAELRVEGLSLAIERLTGESPQENREAQKLAEKLLDGASQWARRESRRFGLRIDIMA